MKLITCMHLTADVSFFTFITHPGPAGQKVDEIVSSSKHPTKEAFRAIRSEILHEDVKTVKRKYLVAAL